MAVPEPVKIIETPNHFWFGGVDLAYAVQGETKVEKLGNDFCLVTKTFVARSYELSEDDGPFDALLKTNWKLLK